MTITLFCVGCGKEYTAPDVAAVVERVLAHEKTRGHKARVALALTGASQMEEVAR